ncbi:LemA family protein [Salinivibrio sp. PR6]|uniref:LemA family protein n=1 Tax=Salinivibrio sp. PR6 TaxID=1909485 RepID=UPI0009896DB3|nr:LemA family protein [Salinivibrio sp. PR6]OOE84719.1 LemA family protein [Salinivibrio sp. PR6]
MGLIITVIILVLLTSATFYLIGIYNRLVAVKHNVSKAWSNIDVLLKQRHDELPKLVDTAKQYMSYEQETLVQVINARNQVEDARQEGDAKKVGHAEEQLRGGMGQLLALAEEYPDLKADESFQQLQSRISELENQIADRREFYNASVNTNNIRIEQFPDVLIANLMNFKAFDLLEFQESEKQDHNLSALFGN